MQMEKILALEDSHEDKKDLVNLLGTKAVAEHQQTLWRKFELNDWKIALPLVLFLSVNAVANDIVEPSVDAFLAIVFALWAGKLANVTGPGLAKSLDEDSVAEFKEVSAVEEFLFDKIKDAISANELAITMEEDYLKHNELTDALNVAQADVLNHMEVHKYRDAIFKKLESLAALEESAITAIRQRMLTRVHKDVVSSFKSDKKLQEAALTQAIAVLSGGPGTKLGKDIVGSTFVSALQSYREGYAKQPAGSDEILTQLEKDMASVAAAPVVESKGGNVFLISPIA